MSNELALAIVGVMVIISQITLIGMKIRDKQVARHERNGSGAPSSIPGLANICQSHSTAITEANVGIRNIMRQRKEDNDSNEKFRENIRESLTRIYDKLDEIKDQR